MSKERRWWRLGGFSGSNPPQNEGADINQWFIWGGFPAASGEFVTEETALQVPALWQAVDFLSSSLASLPIKLYRKEKSGRKEQQGKLANLVQNAPNPHQSSYDWRKYFWERVFLGGRCISIIRRGRASRTIREIYTPDPALVEIERKDGEIKYRLTGGEDSAMEPVDLRPEDVIDVAFMLNCDGVTHKNPLYNMREVIAQQIGALRYSSKFFAGGGVTHMKVTGPFVKAGSGSKAAKEISGLIRAAFDNNENVVPVPDGYNLEPMGIEPEKTQLTETLKFGVEQIARIYGMPPTMLQDLSKGTYSNTEQGDIHVVKHTLRRWATCFEQQANLKMFGQESNIRYFEHDFEAMLRGDMKSYTEAMARAIQTGQKTPDEVRERNNLPSMPGGNRLYIQGATVPLEDVGTVEPPPEPTEQPPDGEGNPGESGETDD